MRIHPKLLLLSLINFLGSLAMFYVLNRGISNDNKLINMFIGWIIWLGIFAIVFPVLIKDEVKEEWFSDKYATVSIIIFAANIFIPMLSNFISLKLV
jgi:hypothetical protein